jgi:serine/threonine protein kinase
MHDHKMMHLDLKPKNIMLKSDGSPVVIDFGLSKQFDSDGEPESSSSIGQGTPGYAPLEQANQTSGSLFQPTLDIYALGATLYKMLTGTTVPSASDILNEGFPEDELRRKSVTTKTIEAIKCAMAPMRKNRPQTVDEFLSLIGERNNASISYEDEETIVATVDKSQTTKGDETVIRQNKDRHNTNPERNKTREKSSLSKNIPAIWIGFCMFLMAVFIGYCIYDYFFSDLIFDNIILSPFLAVGGIVIEIGLVLLSFRRRPGVWFVLVGGAAVAILLAMRAVNFLKYKNWEDLILQSFIHLIMVYIVCFISYFVFQIKNKDGQSAWQMLRPGLFNKR